jgi:hypothetical protein
MGSIKKPVWICCDGEIRTMEQQQIRSGTGCLGVLLAWLVGVWLTG